MSATDVKRSALSSLGLLHDVVDFKKRFYRCPWARYEEAKPGTFRLLPSGHHERELRVDYEKMTAMLFGEILSFKAILSGVASLEREINALRE